LLGAGAKSSNGPTTRPVAKTRSTLSRTFDRQAGGQGFFDGPSDRLLGDQALCRGQGVIDAVVSPLPIEEAQAHRRMLQDHVEQRDRLVPRGERVLELPRGGFEGSAGDHLMGDLEGHDGGARYPVASSMGATTRFHQVSPCSPSPR